MCGHLTIHTLCVYLHPKLFSQAGPNNFLSSYEYITIFPRVTLPRHSADHSNPFSAKVKNERSCTSTPPRSFMARSKWKHRHSPAFTDVHRHIGGELQLSNILGAFVKFRKATISFVMAVRPSVCLFIRMEQLGSHGTDFH